MDGTGTPSLRRPPAIARLLGALAAQDMVAAHGRPLVVQALRAAVADFRAGAGAGPTEAALLGAAAQWLARHTRGPRPVLNLTGTVLHTNLGRAPLPPAALAAMAAAAGAADLEIDLSTGRRGERDSHLEALLCSLTGAEAALAVNNNAAAVLLLLRALAPRREVVVSRGELVEIGGAFRIPDIMREAGCRLREVGTTNRTHARDYAEAIGPRTALLMKVHRSNYRIEGFAAEVAEEELAAIAHRHALPMAVDLGSGSLHDLARWGLPREPTVGAAIAAGADLVTFSGDKLLGGPQAGLVVGRAALVDRLRRHPLKRALRLDKTTIAALVAVLRLQADPDRLPQRLPALRLLLRPQTEIAALAERLRPAVAAALQDLAEVSVIACDSQIGSGARPADLLPSAALALRPRRGRTADALAAALRRLPVPALGRVARGSVVLDLRCLEDPAAFEAQLPLLPGLIAG
ncbi:L-seryl-tRNA(Sec) selenium transferase [Dankookia sp. P2]|uniref:L-seryl-tRNA(Sec) selenium transferase n=1 Tax=Dankookia sp. P2 TaxID=3423955 RepID=UPI003D672746